MIQGTGEEGRTVIEAGDFQIRTDLALETQEHLREKSGEVRGVRVTEEHPGSGVKISTVTIETENASKLLGRPRGRYMTIEADQMGEEDGGYHREISLHAVRCIRRLLPEKDLGPVERDLDREVSCSVLVAGLGNREITPDALGPSAVDRLFVTRHLIREFGRYAFGKEHLCRVSAIVPGVMGQTGMECQEILRGVVRELKPQVIVTIDALAARSMSRLGRTIQLTDTGITPGSGVGNRRDAINRESLGVPVISIGVPTVVDAATIVADAMGGLINEMTKGESEELVKRTPRELAHKSISPQLNGMFVTPKDIDSTIRHLSALLSEALNIAFLGNWQALEES